MKNAIVKTMDWMLFIAIGIAMVIAFKAAGIVGLLITLLVSVTLTCFWFAVSLLCSRLEETNKLLTEISGKLTKKLHEH